MTDFFDPIKVTNMDSETAEALEASIEHWKQNAAAKTPLDISVWDESCALCDLFNNVDTTDRCCEGCPVNQRTGVEYCIGSPWKKAERAYWNWVSTRSKTDCGAFRAAALEEIAFLESLREPK